MCSASEISHLVLEEFQRALRKKGIKHSFVQKFSCEVDDRLRDWGRQAVPDTNCCQFVDIRYLGQKTAYCKRHNGYCTVVSVEGVIIGFSCKDFSRANPNRWRREAGSVLASSRSKGKSADMERLFGSHDCTRCGVGHH